MGTGTAFSNRSDETLFCYKDYHVARDILKSF